MNPINREADVFAALSDAKAVIGDSLAYRLWFFLGKAIVLALLHIANRIDHAGRR